MICSDCPRRCGVDRAERRGVCGMAEQAVIARAALHMWEEPCISGERGSGTVFFSGCNLGCVFCQNAPISAGGFGKAVTAARLREIFFELYEAGAHNINLVTPSHFARPILEALEGGLPLPVVYNTSAYDSVETLRLFAGKVQIYLPDFKFADGALAARLCRASDYPEIALEAIREMFRQVGPYELDGDGLLARGVVIRHLVLPGQLENTRRVMELVAREFEPGQVLFSLMSQYTPPKKTLPWPELNRRLSQEEYDTALDALEQSGITDGFYQELSSAKEEYIPPFDLTGV